MYWDNLNERRGKGARDKHEVIMAKRERKHSGDPWCSMETARNNARNGDEKNVMQKSLLFA